MTSSPNRTTRLPSPFREPILFRVRLVWATTPLFRLIGWFLLAALAVTMVLAVLPLIGAQLAFTAQLISQPGVSTLVGAIIGASISLSVSYTLQRGQFRARSLLDKRETIYGPLLESVISFIHQLEDHPYPSRIAHIAREPNFSLQPQAGFLTWADVVSSGQVTYVPDWLRRAFEEIERNLAKYNQRVRDCAREIQDLLASELIRRGLIESASGFSDVALILAGDYDARIAPPSLE